jgi:hypothetical protein
MSDFEVFVAAEQTRIMLIVAACNLAGDFGDFHGPPSFEFWVDGDAPTSGNCCNCQSPLSETESIDSGDWNVEFWLSCDGCGLVWYDGRELIN